MNVVSRSKSWSFSNIGQGMLHALFLLVLMIMVSPIFAKSHQYGDSGDSFLWEVGYQGQRVGLLFGTVHMGTSASAVPVPVKQALDQDATLVTEIQVLFPSARAEQEAYGLGIAAAFPPVPETIEMRFSETYQERVRNALRRQKVIILNQQDQLSNEFILMLMMLDIGKEFQADYGMEKLLKAYIADRDIHNMALEGISESLQYYVDASKPLAKQMIEAWLDNTDMLQNLNQQLIQSYEANDIERFTTLMTEMEAISFPFSEYESEIAHYYDQLLFQRNDRWLETLTPILQENAGQTEYVIAVGAFHLLGEKGMVELLRQAGFDVTPVSY